MDEKTTTEEIREALTQKRTYVKHAIIATIATTLFIGGVIYCGIKGYNNKKELLTKKLPDNYTAPLQIIAGEKNEADAFYNGVNKAYQEMKNNEQFYAKHHAPPEVKDVYTAPRSKLEKELAVIENARMKLQSRKDSIESAKPYRTNETIDDAMRKDEWSMYAALAAVFGAISGIFSVDQIQMYKSKRNNIQSLLDDINEAKVKT